MEEIFQTWVELKSAEERLFNLCESRLKELLMELPNQTLKFNNENGGVVAVPHWKTKNEDDIVQGLRVSERGSVLVILEEEEIFLKDVDGGINSVYEITSGVEESLEWENLPD